MNTDEWMRRNTQQMYQSTTHQPATPLPWTNLPYVNSDRENRAIVKDDLFELHAANMYAIFVHRLRKIANGDPDAAMTATRMLLLAGELPE